MGAAPAPEPEAGRLADQRGMLLTELGLLRQAESRKLPVVLAHFLSVPKRQSLVRDLLDGQLWSVVSGLGTSLGSGSLQIRDLGALRALTDLGALELVANLEALGLEGANGTDESGGLAQDLRWLAKVLPRGDRGLVAMAHAVLSWVMVLSFVPDSDGLVRVESMSSITQAWWLAEQAASANVRHICEVGFNAGHSAFAMLLSADARMTSFDLMSKSYTPACHRLLRMALPHRHIMVEGPSNVTIPRFVLGNLDHRCDLIFIDGGHLEEEALWDLAHVSLLATARSLVVMDDIGCSSAFCEGPTRAWRRFLGAGRVRQLGCQQETERSWCWGSFLF
ncbi:unnamed protein product [Effrenium voratum]|uniref:Uncharacterized protein n=1 Tax=Effrenium voratum TaxID=2562239 RepID=A0AA36N0J2_9DINO|nr:unnamed protein product [Effrenium voratum]